MNPSNGLASGWPFFNVYPRYTPGSPALVRREIAERLMRNERAVYDDMIKGVYGPAKKAEAMQLGLRSIVEESWEFRGVMMYRDCLTGEVGAKLPCDFCRNRHAIGKWVDGSYQSHPDELRHHPDPRGGYWEEKKG
jgi:hypothetical protein